MSFTDSNGLIHYPGCADICGNHPHDPRDYPCVCQHPRPAKGKHRQHGYRRCLDCQALIVPTDDQIARRDRLAANPA